MSGASRPRFLASSAQVLYQFTFETSQSVDGHVYALIKTCSIICNMQLNVLNDLAEAMKALDGKKCWEFRLFSQDNASSLTTSLRPCIVLFLFGMRCRFFGVTMFSNQVGRTDLTPVALAEFVFLMLSLRRL